MFGRTGRLWMGVVLVLIGAALLFVHFIVDTPLVLLAVGVLVLAAGTLVIAVAQRERPV